MDYRPEKMRARFAELTKEYDKRAAKLEPLHKKLGDLLAKNREEELAIREQIAKAKDGLYDIEMERATLARALGGKTGQPGE